jgi:hypothetical protein
LAGGMWAFPGRRTCVKRAFEQMAAVSALVILPG